MAFDEIPAAAVALPVRRHPAGAAARGTPLKPRHAAFGEIGLTGRLRPAAQAARRLEECAKLGLTAAIAPGEVPGADGKTRVVAVETLRQAVAAGLAESDGASSLEV